MKALVHQLRTGRVELVEAPDPGVQDRHVLIRTTRTVVSAGTERMLLNFGRGNWFQKLKQQPDAARAVLDKVRRDGLRPALRAVSSKLDSFTPLGYCHAGIVTAVGRDVTGYSVGDRVASNGPHASLVSVPHNLVAKIPAGVSDEEAAFTPLAAIALQGIRLAQVSLGETVVVIGLGLIGSLAAQLLRAAGCQVLGIDADPAAVSRVSGIEARTTADAVEVWVASKTGGRGADAVLLATAGNSREPVLLAAKLARQRGRIVLIGTADLKLDRSDFFRKELTFQVSSSYGPGRYDPAYETRGQDYPAGYVRWTAGRNFEAVLQAMAGGALQLRPLIGTRVPLEGYETVYHPDFRAAGAVVFEYGGVAADVALKVNPPIPEARPSAGAAGFIGAGAFAQGTLLPIFKKLSVPVAAIASAGGLSAGLAAKRFGIGRAVSDYHSLLQDPAIDHLFIATRHDSHAGIAAEALRAGKHVFVEKPLALTPASLDAVADAARQSGRQLTVGFNRRFAPLALRLHRWCGDGSGLHLIYTINAGALPAGHWTTDPQAGGGRLLGEGCHFIDFCTYLCQSNAARVCATALSTDSESISILLRFENGSTAAIQYITGGSVRYDKERIEVHRGGETALLLNWKKLELWGTGGRKAHRETQDKGHAALVQATLRGVRDGTGAPIPLHELIHSTRATLAAAESLQTGRWATVAQG